jgi:hypothetical protein
MTLLERKESAGAEVVNLKQQYRINYLSSFVYSEMITSGKYL